MESIEMSEEFVPIDIYQRTREKIRDMNSKSYPHGTSQITNMAVTYVVDGHGAEGLAHAYKRARDDTNTATKYW